MDGEVVNFFRVMQDPQSSERLEALLRVTPFAHAEFLLAYKHSKDPVERDRRTIIKACMGFGSDSITRPLASSVGFNSRVSTMKTGFRAGSRDSGTAPAQDWANYPSNIAAFCRRLQGVVIENREAIDILEKFDRHDTLHYCDPPYPFRSRTEQSKRYKHEMSDEDHISLGGAVHKLAGMVVISGYSSDLYLELYKDWESIEWTARNFCHGGQKRTEIIWLNPAAYELSRQKRLELAYA